MTKPQICPAHSRAHNDEIQNQFLTSERHHICIWEGPMKGAMRVYTAALSTCLTVFHQHWAWCGGSKRGRYYSMHKWPVYYDDMMPALVMNRS